MGANETRTIALAWAGPFPFAEVAAGVCRPAWGAGVYVWTARVEAEWWAYYVGLTAASFAERYADHLRSYWRGLYRIYDPAAFALGCKALVWNP